MHAPVEYLNTKSVLSMGMDDLVEPTLGKMKPVKPFSLLLDYGCGPGVVGHKFLVPLAAATKSYLDAVDVSPSMIEFAKASFSHPRVNYFVGNILDEKDAVLRNRSYDMIFSNHVFHYIQDFRTAIKNFYQILKPGGEFGFTFVGRADLFQMYSRLGKSAKLGKCMKGIEDFIPKYYQECPNADCCQKKFDAAAVDAGFKIVHSQVHYLTQTVDTEGLVEMYMSLNPLIKSVPVDLLEDLRQEYREMSASYGGQKVEDKTRVLQHEVLNYVLKKPE